MNKARRQTYSIFPKGFNFYILLVGISIVANYMLPVVAKDLWFLFLLYFYYRSKDEVLWFAFIMTLHDGFAGFFGSRGVNIEIIPGLPQLEYGHLFIVIAFLKIIVHKKKSFVFYVHWLGILFSYILFLVISGYAQGVPLEYNFTLRVIRLIFPIFLIYLLPKLITTIEEYERLFAFIFFLGLMAFMAQFFSVVTGTSPMTYLGLKEGRVFEDLEQRAWRGFYNVTATLMSFFLAQFYLGSKKPIFNRFYLQIILIASFGTVFLSATRGWIVGYGISLLLFLIFVIRINIRKLFIFSMVLAVFFQLLMLQPRIRTQFYNSFDRFMTLEALVEGDLTAGGTVQRATERGPRVMKKWAESPLIGFGFSDTFYKTNDGHVGNQNILLHSGVVGALLLLGFWYYFFFKLIGLSHQVRKKHWLDNSLLVFPIFFLGWFFIHSTSGQHFGYYLQYRYAFAQAIFFSFGAIVYNHIQIEVKRNG